VDLLFRPDLLAGSGVYPRLGARIWQSFAVNRGTERGEGIGDRLRQSALSRNPTASANVVADYCVILLNAGIQ
jgi:hypothetical protein